MKQGRSNRKTTKPLPALGADDQWTTSLWGASAAEDPEVFNLALQWEMLLGPRERSQRCRNWLGADGCEQETRKAVHGLAMLMQSVIDNRSSQRLRAMADALDSLFEVKNPVDTVRAAILAIAARSEGESFFDAPRPYQLSVTRNELLVALSTGGIDPDERTLDRALESLQLTPKPARRGRPKG